MGKCLAPWAEWWRCVFVCVWGGLIGPWLPLGGQVGLMDGTHSVDHIATALLLTDAEVTGLVDQLNAALSPPPICVLYK